MHAQNISNMKQPAMFSDYAQKHPTRYCLPGLVAAVSTFAAKCSHCGLDCLCGLGL